MEIKESQGKKIKKKTLMKSTFYDTENTISKTLQAKNKINNGECVGQA